MALRAVSAALQGIATGDVRAVAVGAASPYLNKLIKEQTGDNKQANLLAHAILGGVEAAVVKQNIAAGATGALVAEAAAPAITQILYGTSDPEKLTDSQKQNITTLSQISANLTGALVGNSTQAAAVSGEIGKRAVEDNYLSRSEVEDFYKELLEAERTGKDTKPIFEKYHRISKANDEAMLKECGEDSACYAKYFNIMVEGQEAGQSYIEWNNPARWSSELNSKNRGKLSSIVDKENWQGMMAVPNNVKLVYGSPIVAAGFLALPNVATESTLIAAGFGGGSELIGQLINKDGDLSKIDYTKVGISTITGIATKNMGILKTAYVNSGVEILDAFRTKEDLIINGGVSFVTSVVGGTAGKIVENPFNKLLNPNWKKYEYKVEYKPYPIYSSYKESIIPSIMGNSFDNFFSKYSENKIKEVGGENDKK